MTAKRSSPVFSDTKAFFASDQPSLKEVESAEIQISRMGVFGKLITEPEAVHTLAEASGLNSYALF